jgi:hypothetical protein
MATETLAKPFYKHENYVATYYALYIALEKWLANNIFRKDVSRVFLASNEYAFRRRFELTDTSQDYRTAAASALHFPFANYWTGNVGWQPDERVAANTATLVEVGISERSRMLRAMSVTMPAACTFYFDREDDARLAYEKLLYTSYREQFLTTTVMWNGEVLGVPLNIKVEELQFNPNYKEGDWLVENRVFTIQATLNLRSYSLYPPEQPIYTSELIPENNERFELTEEVILELRAGKRLPEVLTIDSLFNQNPEIIVNYFRVVSTTATTCRIEWDVEAEELDIIRLAIRGRDEVNLSAADRFHTFRKLTENSTYAVTIMFITKTGLSKSLALQFNTPLSVASAKVKEAEKNSLVGTTW